MESKIGSIRRGHPENATPRPSSRYLSTSQITDSDQSDDDDISEAARRSIMRRVDLRVILVPAIILCLNAIDRASLGSTAVAGMAKELELHLGSRFSIIALMFFIPYTAFNFPAALLARAVGVKYILSSTCFLWGLVTICSGLVKNWKQLVGMRAMLGLFEAPFAPTVIYLVSTYYTRFEMQKKYSVIDALVTIPAAFGAIVGYGISQMDDVSGLHGWRWIYIIFGILTIATAVFAYLLLVDFPDRAANSWRFLAQDELTWIIRRIDRDRADAETEAFSWKKFFNAGLNPRLWCWGLIRGSGITIGVAVPFFLPTILHKDMGFSVGASQCLLTPPYVISALYNLFCGWIGDKYHTRASILVVNASISIAGLCTMTWANPNGVRYFGAILTTAANMANGPALLAYQANNIRGQWTRAFASASVVSWGGIGGIAGSLIFRSQDAPRYLNGIYGCLVANSLVIILTSGLTIHLAYQNRRARNGEVILENKQDFLYTL